MNRKQLIILLAALIVLGGAWFVIHNNGQKEWDTSGTKLGQKLLPNFPLNDVATLRIKGDGEVDLVKKDEKWRVQQRNDYPANFAQISELLISMGNLKIAQTDPIGSSQLGRMHLGEPGSGPDGATLVEFKDAQGKTLQSLLLGKKHTHKSERQMPMQFGDGEMPDGRYILLKSDTTQLITVSDPLNSVDPKPASWLDKDFFKIDRPSSISFVSTNATNSWTVTRAAESDPWVLSNIKPGEMMDSNKVSSLGSALSYASFVDVAPDQTPAKTGLDKPEEITIKTFDHFTYDLKVGSKTPENDYNMTVTVTADFPKERVASKDEKPDDKKKFDQLFADKLKPMEDKLKQEQALDHWVYVVNSYLLDPMVRDRSQLMVEKKDEKKGDKKSSDAATDSTPEEKPEETLPAPTLDSK